MMGVAVPRIPSFSATALQYETSFPIIIRSEIDFIDRGFQGSGSSEDPFIIEDLMIDSDTSCVSIEDTTSHFIIRDCLLMSDGGAAVILTNVYRGTIDQCVIVGGQYGISLKTVYGTIITNNTVHGSEVGIHLGIVYDCSISDNIITRCLRGIEVTGFGSGSGAIFTGNKVYGNRMRGIDLADYTENNTLYTNLMGWNGGPPSMYPLTNADDDGANNHWDDNVSQGNSWSDYGGLGVYEVGGSSVSIDHFPSILTDNVQPAIEEAEDVLIQHGAAQSILSWVARDDFPNTYEIFVDGSEAESGTWLGNDIEFDLSSLTPQVYNITLSVSEYGGHTTLNSVIV
ncbi:MAG: NosD domain-containing protein [Candidatus Thorarchaeota archaeon]|jgi:parallel beta-helix repeat protein